MKRYSLLFQRYLKIHSLAPMFYHYSMSSMSSEHHTCQPGLLHSHIACQISNHLIQVMGERGGSVVECWTPEREVGGSIPTAAVLCP